MNRMLCPVCGGDIHLEILHDEGICDTCGLQYYQGIYTDDYGNLVEIDDLGGIHSCGTGINPNGVYCGECIKSTCEKCVNVHKK